MSASRRYKAKGQSLVFIKNLLEAYDNLAVMTVVDGRQGIFEVKCPDSLAEELGSVIKGISEEVDLKEG